MKEEFNLETLTQLDEALKTLEKFCTEAQTKDEEGRVYCSIFCPFIRRCIMFGGTRFSVYAGEMRFDLAEAIAAKRREGK